MPSSDDRGITPVLGFILVVGILVLAVSAWQVQVVPIENGNAEHAHYERVTNDLTELRNEIMAVGSRGRAAGVNVHTGMRYPNRVVLVNPGPVSGELATGDSRSVRFENVRAIDTEAKNTRTYWEDSRDFEDVTKDIVYNTSYNYNSHRELPPVVVSGEAVFGATDTSVVSFSEQTLIDGNQIRLTFISGNLSTARSTATVIAEPTSTSLRTVTVTGNGSAEPLRLRVDPPTHATTDAWVASYGNEIQQSSSRVTNVTSESGQIVIEFDQTKTYQLQLASVRVGSEATDPTMLEPAYVIAQQGDGISANGGQDATVVAEVRDQFNNPVRSANVTYEIIGGDGQFRDADGNSVTGPRTVSTDADGRARQTLQVKSIGEDVIVEASVEGVAGSLGTTTFRIQTPEETNPVQLAGVRFDGVTNPPGSNNIGLRFENVVDEDRFIEKFRMDFYQGSGVTSGEIDEETFQVGGIAVTVNIQLSANSTTTVVLSDLNANPSSGDWFILTVTYDTGDTAQYFGAF